MLPLGSSLESSLTRRKNDDFIVYESLLRGCSSLRSGRFTVLFEYFRLYQTQFACCLFAVTAGAEGENHELSSTMGLWFSLTEQFHFEIHKLGC